METLAPYYFIAGLIVGLIGMGVLCFTLYLNLQQKKVDAAIEQEEAAWKAIWEDLQKKVPINTEL